jgi:hypothetical protein
MLTMMLAADLFGRYRGSALCFFLFLVARVGVAMGNGGGSCRSEEVMYL